MAWSSSTGWTPLQGWNTVATVASFATWDPANKSSNIALSGGNLTGTSTGGTFSSESARATKSHSTGKFYYEFVYPTYVHGGAITIGVANASTGTLTGYQVGQDANSLGWRVVGDYLYNGGVAGTLDAVFTNEIAQIAIDIGAGLIWFRNPNRGTTNWNANGSADPATGTGGISVPVTGALFPAFSIFDTGDVNTANFGASAYTYTKPTGFSDW